MDLIIDGHIYQKQQYGGISRLYNEMLPRICDMHSFLSITLLISGHPKQSLPFHSQISYLSVPQIERYLRPSWVWGRLMPQMKSLMKQLMMRGLEGKIWHSTYYTMPLWWKGPKVVTIYDTIHEHFPNYFGKDAINFKKKKRRCLEAADAIICISQTTKEDLHTFYNINKNRICVTPLACSDTFMKPGGVESSISILTQKPFLLYVGMRTHYKNTDLLIKAYSQWHHKREIDLVIVGRPWTYDQINELLTPDIKNRVHILGYVDDNMLVRLYGKAVALVFPSLYEGFGIPLLEAMACGCPIVASKIPSTLEVAGDCPIYFEPTNLEEMLNAFNTTLSEGRNSERVAKGLEKVKNYSWDKTAEKTLKVYYALSNSA